MGLRIRDAEVCSVTEDSVTVAFAVDDGAAACDAPAQVRIGGRRVEVAATAGLRLVRIDGLSPATEYRVDIEVAGAAAPPRDDFFPAALTTLPAPSAAQVASLATLNDLHVGEVQFGGVPGFTRESLLASDTEVPYWRFMLEDAIAEIDAAGVDLVVVKGDIADRGLREQLDDARAMLDRLATPWCGFAGNHDTYGALAGEALDPHAVLGQPPLPRAIDLGGWRLLLVDSVLPGHHHGRLADDQLAWLADALDATRDAAIPTLVFMHHQPVPPEFARGLVNAIGITPADSVRLFELVGAHPQLKAVLCGHTHRNRVRRYPAAGAVPFVEVQSSKDYPGGWAHYRLHADGSFRQETRRTASPRALAHSARCGRMFDGGYRRFAIGGLADRCFTA